MSIPDIKIDVRSIEEVPPAENSRGDLAFVAEVAYNSTVSRYLFTGSKTGAPGPIWITIRGFDVEVETPERFGVRFNRDWVEKFYA